MAKKKKKQRRSRTGAGPWRRQRPAARVRNKPAPAPVPVNPLIAQMRIIAALERVRGNTPANLQTALQQAQRVAQRVQERKDGQGGGGQVKAFTVYQPYAYAIMEGLKQYETRPRRTHIRGRVAIHAARGNPDLVPMAAALALGACGVQVGTCLLASQECPVHENYKQAVLKAKDSDTTVTGRSIGGPVRVLKNKMAREYLALEKRNATLEELETVTMGGLRRAVLEGDVERGSVMMGQVAGMLREIRPVRQIFEELYNGGKAVLEQVEQEWR